MVKLSKYKTVKHQVIKKAACLMFILHQQQHGVVVVVVVVTPGQWSRKKEQPSSPRQFPLSYLEIHRNKE